MPSYLGFDTSNYTTSIAVYDSFLVDVKHEKQLLPVKQGELGLRQSDAVFHHVQQLPCLMSSLMGRVKKPLRAVGASRSPRDVAGSYMPCFTVGMCNAQVLADALNVPCFMFSHQSGHIVAALYSAGRLDLLKQRFLAFHVSGGTTEAVIVEPDRDNIIKTRVVAQTLDLNAGQAIDRVGKILGIDFPAGPKLDELACMYKGDLVVKPTIKGFDCCLSGLENICAKMKEKDELDCKTARFCIEYIANTLGIMCELLLKEYGVLPVLFAGGVMSNSIISNRFKEKYNAVFALPEFSSDNAAGIAILTSIKAEM